MQTDQNKMYNWGIIATGKIAHHFAKDLALIPNARLHAIASRSLEQAQSFAKTYNVPHACGNYETLLRIPDLDVVYIATPHIAHYENTLMCLSQQLPVLCEKPFAMNYTQVREMVLCSQAYQTFLMEALWSRFLPATLKTLELIEDKRLGKVQSIKADFGFQAKVDPNNRLFNLKLGGGALLDIGIYPIFLAYLLLGKPDKIQTTVQKGNTGVDEELGILFQYQQGGMAHLHATFRHTTPCEAYIYGEKGMIKLHSRWHETDRMSFHPHEGEVEYFKFDLKGKGYTYEILEVIECLKQGRTESHLWSLQNSMDLIKLLDEVRQQTNIVYTS